jgi:Tfp pilus assembly protein PilO
LKLSKSSLIIIVAGVVLIGVLFMGYNLFQQHSAKDDLGNKLALAKQQLKAVNTDKLTLQKDNLDAQIAQAGAQIQQLKTQVSVKQDGIDVIDSLLADAEIFNVTIVEMGSPGLAAETVTGSRFQTIPISFRVTGATENIADFIYSLADVFPTGVLKSTQLAIEKPSSTTTSTPSEPAPDGTDGPASIPVETGAANGKTTATLSLVIYNYTGE